MDCKDTTYTHVVFQKLDCEPRHILRYLLIVCILK